MRALSPAWELAREFVEMRGLYETSHALAGDKLERLLPDFHATAFRDVLLASLLPSELAAAAPGVDVDPDEPAGSRPPSSTDE